MFYYSEFQLDQLTDNTVSVREKKYAVEYDAENHTSEQYLQQTTRQAYALSEMTNDDLLALQEQLPENLFSAICAAWEVEPTEEQEEPQLLLSQQQEETESEEEPEEEAEEER